MKKDNVMPKGKWKFDSEVSHSFENMLERSIPQYDVMRASTTELVSTVLMNSESTGFIIDLGCSQGGAIEDLCVKFPSVEFLGIECSLPMLEIAQEKFKNKSNVVIKSHDLKQGIPAGKAANAIISSLTLQFIPIEYRQMIIQNIYNRLLPGGIFIYIEKVLGSNASIDWKMVNIYLNNKKKNGYTEQQIERKRLSLEGVLVPVTAKWNEELLSMAGFRSVDCFWRWMNFGGWIAEK